jgi:hypothetical protein
LFAKQQIALTALLSPAAFVKTASWLLGRRSVSTGGFYFIFYLI